MEIILYLVFAFIGFYITYFVIRLAVKHAISQSLDDIQRVIRVAINQSTVKSDLKNIND
ncbi:hypothetical protein HBE96_00265 [Clostridium sp. P21]|uniref:Uncharacterized protein n=1 Tax=Clostridium muellerianum TaxID=2716538 RepID=A0A7Y0ECX6_9CLOT|nr:hypothetical protein [Clostridium muellerianum]NMM61160.1 hypothetical protein [Clostridium muellerianum]